MANTDRSRALLIARILFLEGSPSVDPGKLLIGKDIMEAIANHLKLEESAPKDLKSAISDCEAVNDYVSRELIESILESEEEHRLARGSESL